jgi:hypothetical protein
VGASFVSTTAPRKSVPLDQMKKKSFSPDLTTTFRVSSCSDQDQDATLVPSLPYHSLCIKYPVPVLVKSRGNLVPIRATLPFVHKRNRWLSLDAV